MDVLERDAHLAVLGECLEAARGGAGRLVFVLGEAGIGKTTLVERFAAGVRGGRVAVGACDPMDTPRPLGSLLEIAERLGMVDAWEDEPSREALVRAFVEELSSRSLVTVGVVEDAHWADEATLDVIRFIGRRLSGMRGLIVVTCRDDELDATHPLRTLVGDLATAPGVVRMQLETLSHAAVAELASATPGVDVHALYAQTGGNPFFVTEVLASGDGPVPPSVRDAVLARAARLSPEGRAALDAAAVVPTRAETWLVHGVAGVGETALDECVAAGMLRPDAPGTVAFRHELARRAVDESLPPARRAGLHARVAALVLDRHGERAEAARVAYHAEQAGDGPLARVQAVRAARRAAELGAHREAVAQYERALRHADGLAEADRADLLEGCACEARVIDRMDTALDAASQAVTLRRRLGDQRALGGALQEKARVLSGAGHSVQAVQVVREAIRILEALEPGKELAEAYAGAASYAMLARDHPAALAWGEKAIGLAERLGATGILAAGLNSVGSSKLVSGRQGGFEDLRRSITVAADTGHEELVVRGWGNVGSGAGEVRDYATAEPALREGLAFAADRDLDFYRHYMSAWLARVRLEQGDWVEATGLLDALQLEGPAISPITTIVALGVRSRLRGRCGDADPGPDLERAWALAVETGDLQRLWPIAAARAEAAWLAGDVAAIPNLVDDVYALACAHGHAWAVGELGLWRHRGGRREPLPDLTAEPWALQVAGRHADAAARWQTLGCPYETADALADSGEPAELRRALEILDNLGATAAAARVRRRLRDLGVRGIPRGPRPATATNPAGLTPRQVEVLGLLAVGLSDADIAARLHLSPKTVGHHVSAILAKLDVASRGEAAHQARALGLAGEDGGSPTPP